jgi:IPT/TIG domain
MNIFAGKSPTEKKKIIVALVLGSLALVALTWTIFIPMFSSKKTVTVSLSPTPTASATPGGNTTKISNLPTQEEIDFQYVNTPVVYAGAPYAPDAGRNIFAFYEPPPPTPYSPTPVPTPTPYIPPVQTPTPQAPQAIGFISPQSVYAGGKAFLLEINGDGFTPDTHINFNGNDVPTTYVSPQRLTANIPSNFIGSEGQKQIFTRTPDGKLYSYPVMLNVLAPPTPQFKYIGMLGRQRYNNDTAYFEEPGKDKPTSARLNDVVGGRFRVMSISSAEVIFEDVNLGFKHRLPLYRPAPGTTTGATNNPNNPNYNPNVVNPTVVTPNYNTQIPGIPDNIPRYNPTNTNNIPQKQQQQQQKLDDEDGDN